MSEPTFEELHALGVPVALLARRFNMAVSSAYYKATRQRQDYLGFRHRERLARVERIKANINASPSLSMFIWEKAA